MQNRIEFINYNSGCTGITQIRRSRPSSRVEMGLESSVSGTIESKSNKHTSPKAKPVPPKATSIIPESITPQHITPHGIYRFGDDKFQIIIHDNVDTHGNIKNKNIKFSVSVKSNIVPKQKTVCEHDFYFNYYQNTIVIGKIKDGKSLECVKLNPINNNTINLYSLLYALQEDARKACGQCNGSLYLLITYYIINFIISKGLINPTIATFTLYDNAVKTTVSNNASIQSNNMKLSAEQLIKYSRTYYEAFGFLPHIIYTTKKEDLLSDNGVPKAIAPTDANYLEYFTFLVKKRKEILNMTVNQIKDMIHNSDKNIMYNFWKINNKQTDEYVLFVNLSALKEIIHNASDGTIKLNKFLSTYPDFKRIHMLFFLPEDVNKTLLDKRVIRIYTPQSILKTVIKIYNDNSIQIYEPYFHTVKLIK